ncbi:hypothetical protein BOW53_10410 [Solemya pervernicosa gill symbiont]|uniref:OmpA-like domain-containing protein n=2 Tax=Gammaproteobacteria incertae sedis TaxID=118884 RepID=A0A1T2L3S6_9GAMM|nr:OmpA family protein [Candidatus Reidiella endopervernicosa]OOZ39722.1 hypothetical protein BOW53_10410 [Solemya pervernicosa gill symbiont]QKQ26647.1 OmpA family protein [Candidatus Reidiella endopervernicosa]
MKKLALCALVCIAPIVATSAAADTRYAGDSRSVVVKNAYGECWNINKLHTNIKSCGGGVQSITLGAHALFDTNSADLKPAGKQQISNVVSKVGAGNIKSATVVGHTDSMGDAEYNRDLSDRRAMSVKRYMAGEGVSANRIKTRGRGETMPVASNDTTQGRTKNRRVEIEIVTK